mmetsp:Transcript_46167/g.76924  ORF Transcript_46167/g.76924 Transcript_46167/m.76924 type:complete len:530 (-) Transcript_46167:313-1902(-)
MRALDQGKNPTGRMCFITLLMFFIVHLCYLSGYLATRMLEHTLSSILPTLFAPKNYWRNSQTPLTSANISNRERSSALRTDRTGGPAEAHLPEHNKQATAVRQQVTAGYPDGNLFNYITAPKANSFRNEADTYALRVLNFSQAANTLRNVSNAVHNYSWIKGAYQSYPITVSQQDLDAAEDYRLVLYKNRPTFAGYIDFSHNPGPVYLSQIDYGYVLFPVGERIRPQLTASPQVFLSTLLTGEGFRLDLVEHFLQHYQNLKISRSNMLLSVNVNHRVSSSQLLELVRTVHKYSDYYDVFVGNWSSEALTFHQAHKLLAATRANDWIVTADSDEFHEVPHGNYPQFLRECDHQRVNFVRGIFYDRVSRTGSLAKLLPGKPLGAQFPMACQLFRGLPTGTPKKILAYKANLRINRGHHRLALCFFFVFRGYSFVSPFASCSSDTQLVLKPHARILPVHHFKWMAGIEDAYRYKAARYNVSLGLDKQIAKSYSEVLSHLSANNFRLDLQNTGFRCRPSLFKLAGHTTGSKVI